MSGWQAVALGVLQGAGEFLPISSSGHLIVVPWLLGWAEHGLAFDVALHLGTAAAVLYAYAADWKRLASAAVRGVLAGRPWAEPDARLLWLIAAASVPGGAAGLLLEHRAETVFRSPALVAAAMAVLGLVLLFADRRQGTRQVDGLPAGHALLIGVAQAFAIVPGVSRSGATISMALLLGYRREEAARFSFLLATPITLGAALWKVPHLLRSQPDLGAVGVGMLAAAISGFLAIRLLLGYVRTRDYRPFAYYRFAFAALVAVVVLVGLRRLG